LAESPSSIPGNTSFRIIFLERVADLHPGQKIIRFGSRNIPINIVPGTQPPLPRGWFKWMFWQYSDKGRINGINARVDLNVFNGSLEDLYRFAGAQIDTETPATPQKHKVVAGDTFESIANKYGVTVRELVSANPQLLKTTNN
jgi:hypothetical protein